MILANYVVNRVSVMSEVFRRYMARYSKLNREHTQLIMQRGRMRTISPKQQFLQKDESNRLHTFVIYGCLRCYRGENGNNGHIIRLVTENDWISDRACFFGGEPSDVIVDALQISGVIQWTTEDLRQLRLDLRDLDEFFRELTGKNLEEAEQRIYTTLGQTAEERYAGFLESFGQIANRIPLKQIASYLGVTRETVSRVRNNIPCRSKLSVRKNVINVFVEPPEPAKYLENRNFTI